MEKEKQTYFQYHREYKLPVYLKLNLEDFSSSFLSLLTQMKFQELNEKESAEAEIKIKIENNARCLILRMANNSVSRQIDAVVESDRFGPESITPRDGYKVYRYKGMALMVYSLGAREWELGCTDSFGTEELINASRSILNRYLSWSLSPLGILGFWGVPVDEGMVVRKQNKANGEVIFVDIRNNKLFSEDGVRRLPLRFTILRLDRNLKNRNIKMSNEELFSFLSTHTSHLDLGGHSISVRQILQAISRLAKGLVHPEESFKPRTDLSI